MGPEMNPKDEDGGKSRKPHLASPLHLQESLFQARKKM